MPLQLPIRLPVPPLAGPLQRALSHGGGALVRRLLDQAREAGLEPLSVLDVPPSAMADAPRFALVHEPAPPETRPAFYGAIGHLSVLAITPREWDVWSCGVVGRPTVPGALAPRWGQPLPAAEEDETETRRRRLRGASELWWWQLPAALARDGQGASAHAAAIRDVCERETLPSRFPAVPTDAADSDAVCAATLGVVHATFAGEIAPDAGDELDPDAVCEQPPRTRAATVALLEPLLADLPIHFGHELVALYLAPGPWGTRHQQQLLAVVADDAPLHRAAALRRRLEAHLGMLPPAHWLGAARLPAPVVITVGALQGQLTRRLFRRPLRRLAFRLHAHRLLGDDALFDGLRGADWTGLDLRAELAALITATGALFRPGATDIAARELLLGSWPALIHLCGGGSPLDSLATAHAALAGRTDPALARVGSMALKHPWGRPDAADRGRAAGALGHWGPALLRLQEVALEVLE